MLTMKRIHRDLGGNPCRRCINERYGTNLQPSDVGYFIYPVVCTKCGKPGNVVTGVKISGKLKSLLK